jgi:hypothetical protein
LEVTVDLQNHITASLAEIYRLENYNTSLNTVVAGKPWREIGSAALQPVVAAGISLPTGEWDLCAYIYTNGGTGTIISGRFDFYALVYAP